MKLEPYLSDEIIPDLNNIVRDIEDEGDRCYFGSTNDADRLREIADWLEANFRRTPPASQSDEALVEELAMIICRGGGRGLCVGFCHAKRCADAIEQYSDTARAILPIITAHQASARAEGKREGIEEAAEYLDQFSPKLVESAAAIRALKGERT